MGSFLWTKGCPFLPFCKVAGLKIKLKYYLLMSSKLYHYIAIKVWEDFY